MTGSLRAKSVAELRRADRRERRVGLVEAALEIEGVLVDVTSTLHMTDARLELSGGTLRAKRIVRGSSDFSFSGGTLDVGRFEGALLNAGGVFGIGGDAGCAA